MLSTIYSCPRHGLTGHVAGVQGKEGRWTDEVFQVLDATPEDVIAQRDLYDRPPSLFKSWAKGNCVMIGDAVHPMMPNLGQGGCQAIEDAYILAQRLAAVKDRSDIPSTLQVPSCDGCLVRPCLSRVRRMRFALAP